MRKSEIETLREVVTKVTQLLVGKGIKVTQRGTQAYAQVDPKTLKHNLINIPFIPDNASEALVMAIHGFIDHEVAHVLFTDNKVKYSIRDKPELLVMLNIIEDTLIERLMGEKFPGSVANIGRLHGFFLEKITKPALADAKGDPKKQLAILLVPLARALSGQTVFEEYLRNAGYWDAGDLADFRKRLPAGIAADLRSIRVSKDSLRIARIFLEALYAKQKPSKVMIEPSSNPAARKAPFDLSVIVSPAKSGDKGVPQGPVRLNINGKKISALMLHEGRATFSQASLNLDLGKYVLTVDYKGDHEFADATSEPLELEVVEPIPMPMPGSAGSDSDEPSEEPDDGEGETGEAPKDESSSKKEAPAPAEVEETETDEEPSAAEDEEDAPEPAESEEKDEPVEPLDGEATGEEPEHDDDIVSEGEDDEDEGPEPTEEPETEASTDEPDGCDTEEDADSVEGEDEDSDEDADGGEVLGGEPEEVPADDDWGDEESLEDFDKPVETVPSEKTIAPIEFDTALAAHISKETLDATMSSEYRIFSRDFDIIEPMEVPGDITANPGIAKLDNDVGHMIGPMQKEIERMMASRAQVLKVPGFRSGRLNPTSLHKLRVGDDRVFRRKHETKAVETVVGLLIDNSGSMNWGGKISVAMAAGYALAQTLERVKIPFECMGFTTREKNKALRTAVEEEMNRLRAAGRRLTHPLQIYVRTEPIYMPIFKSFTERMSPQIKARFAEARVGGHMRENIDGECVEIAGQRLLRRSERRRVLLVLSDGQPACETSQPHVIRQHLKSTVQKLSKEGVETIGIGIMSDAVKQYYPKSMVLNDLDALPRTVMTELKRILLT